MIKGIFNYLKEVKDTAKYMLQGLEVTFDHQTDKEKRT